VIQKLPHERGAGGVGRIVRVVEAEIGVDDQSDRCRLVSDPQLVPGVQDAPGLADLPEAASSRGLEFANGSSLGNMRPNLSSRMTNRRGADCCA
jgi:hypothetical protein